MQKVFVHPECPFSAETFKLLEEFSAAEDWSDFYMARKKDFLKYLEQPLKHISSQVEEMLPCFIKKHISIKWEKLASTNKIRTLSSCLMVYSVAFGLEYSRSLDDAQLMLIFDRQNLTFGFYAEKDCVSHILNNYQRNYIDRVDVMGMLKRYTLPNQYYCSLTQKIIRVNSPLPESRSISMEPKKSIYELVEHIISLSELPPPIKNNTITNLQIDISLESEELLGYSAKRLIQKITNTFQQIFPLFLCAKRYDDDSDILFRESYSAYEEELNPVYPLEYFSYITGFQTSELDRWIRTINRKQQAIIQGPPGTGKTFIAEKLAQHLIGGGDGFSDIIQFHPAYTYEDFIQGIRPQSQNGELTYPIVPGRFLEFCKQAEACEDTCVLIIDEINRANLSQVFGELMYLLDDRDRTVKLASSEQFRIPKNVRIIGTMNTADRSIALVDNALRRRFAFIPVYPNYEVLRQYHHREETGFPVDKLTSILEDVNRAINNKHYELGISFFLTKTLAEDIQDIWQMEIEPYLEEYFFDSLEKMDEFLWENIKNKLGY
ncbi:AAA family ATPase [Microcoleus sp. Pol17_C1]|uniref:AAA family ATPase n=1 Tax=unclassified Microcoleus TaxID=2642155 RepID=UPI002FD40035